MFSYVSPESRIPAMHPLRPIRAMVAEALVHLDRKLEKLYSKTGRPSIAPERLIRALLRQVLYTIRSERLLVEQLEYNLLFRWFVGLSVDEPVWDHSTFSKNRDRLLQRISPGSCSRRSSLRRRRRDCLATSTSASMAR